jgi:hypothetical protein
VRQRHDLRDHDQAAQGAGNKERPGRLALTDLRVLTDRGSEYCSNPERHEYELYLAVEDIDHSRTETKNPQTIM